MKNFKNILWGGLILFSLPSCKKFIEVASPATSVNAENVYKDDQTAASVLTGIYARLNSDFVAGGLTSISLKADLSADNMTLFNENQNYFNYYRNQLSAGTGATANTNDTMYWPYLYQRIYTCNAAIEGLETTTTLSPAIRQQLLGEAKFMRAFFYFYAVNLFGDVPLVLSTNYQENALKARTPLTEVYAQLIADLAAAQTFLTDGYLMANASTKYVAGAEERVRPNKAAAAALLARVYLYRKDHSNAELQATVLIGNSNYEILPLANVFKKNSRETIWALQPVIANRNTDEGQFMTLTAAGPNIAVPVYMTDNLEKAFEAGDLRKTNWTGNVLASATRYFYPSKYKVSLTGQPVTEYCIVLRLAEQYLIRAEARAEQNNLTGAISDLDVIRNRAGLPLIKNINPGISKADLLIQIQKDRRSELFTEWGHRWFDLKRLGLADQVLAPLKGNTWQSTDVLYPLPATDIAKNFNLVQNPGYSN